MHTDFCDGRDQQGLGWRVVARGEGQGFGQNGLGREPGFGQIARF